MYLFLILLFSSQQLGCVGRKFFEGLVNSPYISKISYKLKECIDFHRSKLQSEPNSEIDFHLARYTHFINCVMTIMSLYNGYYIFRFYEASTLWLTDVRLLESTLFVPSLDPMYEPNYLTHIINGSHVIKPMLPLF